MDYDALVAENHLLMETLRYLEEMTTLWGLDVDENLERARHLARVTRQQVLKRRSDDAQEG